MSQAKWTAVDSYFSDQFLEDDAMLQTTLQDSINAGLPDINVAPNQGKFLMLLAQMQGARTILEIGTLGAYSTIWLARALPADGKIITLEYDTHHAEIAKKNIARAGFANNLTGGIVLTGGGSMLNFLVQRFEYKTGMHCRIGYPNEHLAGDSDEDITSPLYATAVGLVLDGLKRHERKKIEQQEKILSSWLTIK